MHTQGLIDSHQHFWHYAPETHPWIDLSMQRLRRDFLPDDLKATARPAGVCASIAVQASQALQETAWLLELARQEPFICGVVGWAPLRDARVADHLERFAS